MGFWGIEVKPGKPYPYHSDHVPGRLHVTQATLGLGSSTERSIVQCTIGHKNPIFLCSLLPNKNESCSLDLEFDEDDLVAFSVIGPRSVYLSGYFEAFEEDVIRDDYESDSFGEDIADTESGSSEYGSSDEYGDESDDEFIDDDDDDFNMYPPPAPKSGVIIEEIVDEEKPASGNDRSKRQKKKNQSNGSEDDTNPQHQIVVRGESGINVLESEDEDGFPISSKNETKSNLQKPKAEVKPTDNKTEKTKKKKAQEDGDGTTTNLKRKVDNIDEEVCSEKKKKNKKNKQLKEQAGDEKPDEKKAEDMTRKTDEPAEKQANEKSLDTEMDQAPDESQSQDKKKKKKNKKKSKDIEDGTNGNQTVTATEDQKKPSLGSEQKKTNAKAKVRTYANGLVVEELAMGQPDGKRASCGSNVSVCYIGKLMKNGKIFDSNVGRAPFKFRLGTGQVIKGWDVGINGMRVGDKRRLTIPPDMGYGSKNLGKIPPNSWLVFDVELINVR